MSFILSNFCWGILDSEVMDNVTLIELEDVTRFPTTMSPSVPLVLTISDGRQDPEIVWCTSLAGDTLEVLRGQEGTVPKVWPKGSKIWAMLTAAVIQDFGAVSASQVSFTPAGTIAATNVQDAIQELDSEVNAAIAAIIADLANYQPLDPLLTSISSVGIAANQLLYGTGPDVVAQTPLSAFIRTLLDDANEATARATLLLGALAVLNTVGTGQIDNDAVTLAKIVNIATASFLGRSTAGTGDPEVLTVAQAKTLLNLAGTNTGDQTITLTGNVTGSGTGSFATTIAVGVVTNAMHSNMVTDTVKGRALASGTGAPVDLTRTQLTALLNAFTSALPGAVPASGGGTTNFLRADGTWQPAASKVAQIVRDTEFVYTTLGTIVPQDDTIPQNTEGDEFLAVTITPTNASSTLLIQVDVNTQLAVAGGDYIFAVFVDSTVNAIAATGGTSYTTNKVQTDSFSHSLSAGSTAARTYKVRGGSATATDLKINGDNATRLFGGVMSCSITVTEILP